MVDRAPIIVFSGICLINLLASDHCDHLPPNETKPDRTFQGKEATWDENKREETIKA